MWTFFGAIFVIGYFFFVYLPKSIKTTIEFDRANANKSLRRFEYCLTYYIFWNEIVPEIYAESKRRDPEKVIGVYYKQFVDIGYDLYGEWQPTREAVYRARKYLKEKGIIWKPVGPNVSLRWKHVTDPSDPRYIGRDCPEPRLRYDHKQGVRRSKLYYNRWMIAAPNEDDFHANYFRYSDGTVAKLWTNDSCDNRVVGGGIAYEDAILPYKDINLWPETLRNQIDEDEVRKALSKHNASWGLIPGVYFPSLDNQLPVNFIKSKQTRDKQADKTATQ